MSVAEFEKDDDENCHIDFISALANVRASNYKLDQMDWINVKIKAGRIVPALATTTAAVAGLQTIEMIKYIKGDLKLDQYKNAFINLAVNVLMMSEPGAPPKTTLKKGLDVTLWDRWEYTASSTKVTLKQVIASLEKKHKLQAHDVFVGSVPVYLRALAAIDPKNNVLEKPILEAIPARDSDKDATIKPEPIDLTITFSDPDAETEQGKKTIIKNIPTVRVLFKKK